MKRLEFLKKTLIVPVAVTTGVGAAKCLAKDRDYCLLSIGGKTRLNKYIPDGTTNLGTNYHRMTDDLPANRWFKITFSISDYKGRGGFGISCDGHRYFLPLPIKNEDYELLFPSINGGNLCWFETRSTRFEGAIGDFELVSIEATPQKNGGIIAKHRQMQ